jgi:hypothetical protein
LLSRKLISQVVETRASVIHLAASFIMHTSALTHTSKVYSQGRQTHFIQSSGGTKHNFIVHGAATEWMWMKNESYALTRLVYGLFKDRLQTTVLDRNE